MSLITKLVLATVKQEVNAVVTNSYFKLSTNNVTPSILKGFYLEKIKSNIKEDILFLHSLIKETTGVRKINVINCGNKTANSKKDLYSRNNKSENNAANKYSFNNSSKSSNSGNSNSDRDMILKGNCDCYWNNALIATINFCMIAYA